MREMKDSGIEWIGEIPKDWKIAQVRYLFNIGRGRVISQEELNPDGKFPVYSSQTKDNGCLGYIDTYDFDGEQITWTTDGANAGTIFLRNGKYNCTNVCGTLKATNKSVYLAYQRYALEHIAFYHKRADTNGYKIMNNEMAAIHTLIPPISEQQRIASYLDSKCSKIDDIIEKQQSVIEKLKAYKQRYITELVLGKQQKQKFKETRYFWIGSIPNHWECGQLKFFASIRSGITLGKKYDFNTKLVEVPYLRVANVQGDYVDLNDVAQINVLPEEIEKYSLKPGELLMTEGGDRDKLGRGCIWNGEIIPCLHQNHVFAVNTTSERLDVRYLDYITTSDVARNYFDYTAKKTTNLASTNSTTILEFHIPIPPISEQIEIIKLLQDKCSAIDSTIANKQALIEKLTAYKKSLIYEVVTGKKEV